MIDPVSKRSVSSGQVQVAMSIRSASLAVFNAPFNFVRNITTLLRDLFGGEERDEGPCQYEVQAEEDRLAWLEALTQARECRDWHQVDALIAQMRALGSDPQA